MTKREIVTQVAKELKSTLKLTQSEVSEVVQTTLDCISDTISEGTTIELRNFGVFEVKVRKSRKGRNPNKPEDEVIIPERCVVKFRSGKILKANVDALKPADIKNK